MKKIFFISLIILGVNTCFASHELSQQATAFYSDNNFQKTLELLLQINEHERSAQDWLLLGNLLDEKGERQNAEFMYQKAIFADKKYYKAYYNLANHYLADEKYSFAIENYKLAIKYNKKNPYVYYNLACAYIKQAELKKAKSELIKAVTLNNNIPEIHYNLAYVYKNLGKDKIAKDYLDNYNKLTNQF
ncbi:hypothetical protein J6R97_05120 [bacterium]|nr:hypothetical protein [bacterium]